MADGSTDYNEDDFDEYNPHPYRGGYDIALTYGHPLPPSSATCYPVSVPTSSPIPPPPSPEPSSAAALPTLLPSEPSSAAALPTLPPSEPSSAAALPTPPPSEPTYGYASQESYRAEPFPWPDLFRSWPFTNPWDQEAYGCGRTAMEGQGFLNWRRGLDYLFGHAEGYGERRIGVDSYGVPVYASKTHGGAGSILVEVEPPPVHSVSYYDGGGDRADSVDYDNWFGWRPETSSERDSYRNAAVLAYDTYHSQEPLSVEVNPKESMWYENVSYHEAYAEQVHYNEHLPHYDENYYETGLFATPNLAYNKRYQEEPMHVRLKPAETISYERPSYSDVYQEPGFDYVLGFSSYDKRGDENNSLRDPSYDYERHSYEMPDHVELELLRPAWSQSLGHYEDYDKEILPKPNLEVSHDEPYQVPFSSIFDWDPSWFSDQHKLHSNNLISENFDHAYESHYHDTSSCDQLEPYRPTWSQHAGYYEAHNEPVYPTW